MSNPPYAIRKVGTNRWLASDIDGGGMSVFWVSIFYADHYNDEAAALSMKKRVEERYPAEKIEVVPYDGA